MAKWLAAGAGRACLRLHFFYVVATKIFVLKIVYGVILYVIATKAWHFVLWLIHYLKVKEKHHETYVEYDHEPYHGHHEPYHSHHDHSVQYVIDDESYDHQPYGAYSSSYGRVDTRYPQKKKVYDADGSYSVGG
ncbi:jg2061 [Pararge aegeria aegeria]|uniref:Jg2061 protein n=1 Tax=Pararge aegeria aegeria TaxID=348720 RepID=A0A8S4RET5_9NEOP|nr:jg2061 [Pararge aegeria aegeria]